MTNAMTPSSVHYLNRPKINIKKTVSFQSGKRIPMSMEPHLNSTRIHI